MSAVIGVEDHATGSPPLVRGDERARRLMWLGLVAAFIVVPFFSAPGRYVADTHDAIWFAPGAYLSHALSLWQASPLLGQEQPTAVLMGLFVAPLRAIGTPIWVTERLWHGLLLFSAAAGMVFLVDELRGRQVVPAATAALLYAASPYAFAYGLPISVAFLPYAFLPFLLLVTIRWLPRPGLRGPALFAGTILLMGAGNGAPQVYALFPVAAYCVWAVAIERSVPLRRALAFAGWTSLFVLAVNAYWLIFLSSHEVTNAIAFSEQPAVINVTSSYSETIRGLGFWGFYGGDQFGPWLPVVHRFIVSPVYILIGFVAPTVALLSAWMVRWRLRLFFLLLAILSVLWMAGAFPTSSPTPFGHFLLFSYDHVPGTAGLRTTYKLAGTLNVAVSVLAGVGVGAALEWARRRLPPMPWRATIATGAALVFAAGTLPLWTGGLYQGARSTRSIPGYWQQALDFVDRRADPAYRTFFAPGVLASTYRWGGLMEGLAETRPGLPSVQPEPLPVALHYGTNLIGAVEQPYQGDVASAGAAAMFRYMGVKDVVLQNDIDWQRSHTARPAEMQTLARDPSMRALTTFGVIGENTTPPGPSVSAPDIAQIRVERQLTPVQILTVPDPIPVVHADAQPPIVVSGDAFGIAAAARAGLLDGNGPVLYSGALTPSQLSAIASQQPAFVVTDSNRRRVVSFATGRTGHSYTLPAGATLNGRPIGYGLFDDRTDTQSVAVYEGVRSITASGYGSPLQDQPQYRPANAFDGDPNTSWLVGALGDPVGAWIEVRLERPTAVSRITVTMPDFGFGRRVRTIRLLFSDGSSVIEPVHAGQETFDFEPRMTTSVRLQILGVTKGIVDNGVGFSEIQIPGILAHEFIQTPIDLFDAARSNADVAALLGAAPLTYVFERSRTSAPLTPSEELGIERRFEVPADRPFQVAGTAHLDPTAPDPTIDQLVRGPSSITASSSSRLFGNPAFRASAALDGDPSTAWVPAGGVGEWIQVTFPAHVITSLRIIDETFPGRTPIQQVKVSFSDGSSISRTVNTFTGTTNLRFSPRTVYSVRIEVTGVVTAGAGSPAPVAISDLRIPGVHEPAVKNSAPLGCFSSSDVSMDGTPLPVRPEGTIGDLLSGHELSLTGCGSSSFSLSGGPHDLYVRGALQPDAIDLSSLNASAPPPLPPPAMTVQPKGQSGFDISIRAARAPFYLSIGQNYSPGWKASIDGAGLGPPLLIDGYAAGWHVGRTGSFEITVRYGPQSLYLLSLGISGISVLAVALILVAPFRRRRRR